MRYLLLFLVLLLVPGCMTFVEVAPHEIPTVVQEGDQVRIVAANGDKGSYQVEAVEPDALIVVPVGKPGDSVRMPLSDIAKLSQWRGSAGNTLAGTTLVLGFLLFLVAGAGAAGAVGG